MREGRRSDLTRLAAVGTAARDDRGSARRRPLNMDCAGVGRIARRIFFFGVVLGGLGLVGLARADDATSPSANQPLSVEPAPSAPPSAAPQPETPEGPKLPFWTAGPQQWTSPEGLGSTLQVILLLSVLSLAPAVLLMTTCYVRVVVVLSLLRQALGGQNLPPVQVITTLSLFLTLLVMTPAWKQVYDEAVAPYTRHEIGAEEAWRAGVAPIRRFMSLQIERTRNTEDVWLFMRYLPGRAAPKSYDDVPLEALLPAFMLSELKTAFLIGFTLYLPFLILDMVVASVMVSMGMLMVPPVMVSLPLKLMLFVLVDGWRLVVGTLMESFQPFL